MYARICPDCGCYLDPGERCDCKQQKKHENELLRKQHEELKAMLIVEVNGQFRMAV